jgi:hypothetical protein
MEPFGYRTRLHRFLINWGPEAEARREELAQWLFARHRRCFRRRVSRRRCGSPTRGRCRTHSAAADRAWRPPSIEEVPANRLRVLSVHVPEAP